MSDTLSVKIGDESRDILMSYGLLTELTRLVPRAEYITAIAMDADLRDEVLACLLAKRTPAGRVSEAAKLEEIALNLDDAEKLLAWAQDGLLGFFLRSAHKANALAGRIEKELTPSSGGTEA